MGIVEEECDESAYWMELLIDLGLTDGKRIAGLKTEANEILSITVTSIKTARSRKQSVIRNPQSETCNFCYDGPTRNAIIGGTRVDQTIE